MRKFKAWDKNKMVGPMGLLFVDAPKWLENLSSETILLSFTGLEDADGQEIYEGDIIKAIIKENSLFIIGEIVFDEDWSAYCLKNFAGKTMLWKLAKLKIIDNIYENEEILK